MLYMVTFIINIPQMFAYVYIYIYVYTHHIWILWVLNLSTTWWAQSGEWGHSAIAPSEARVGEYLANASDGDDDVMKRHLFFGGKLR